MTKNIAVIGAGVIGLSTSFNILKNIKNCKVTIFSENFSPDTTGDLSAGFIYPYLCGEGEDVERWLRMTVEYFTELHTLPNALEIGFQSGYIGWWHCNGEEGKQLWNCCEKEFRCGYCMLRWYTKPIN